MSVIKKILIVLFVLLVGKVEAQENVDRLSVKQLNRLALSAKRLNDWKTAATYYEASLSKRPDEPKVLYELAESYRRMGNYAKAGENYKKVFETKGDKYPLSAFYYARMLVATDKCNEAVPVFEDFRKAYRGEKDDRKYIRLSKFSVQGCEELSTEEARKSKILVSPFSNNINGLHVESSPIYLSDGSLVYNSLKTNGQLVFEIGKDSIPQRKFYMLKKENNGWRESGEWDMTKDFKHKEVASGAFNDTKTAFYFTVCDENTLGQVVCDIYKKTLKNGSWQNAERLPETVNTKYTETQVAVGLDEKGRETVYFASDRKEGKGGLDIWYSTYDEKRDTYKEARNLGSKINSVGDEMTPFISQYDGLLYFSSDGHPGHGGLDVFKAGGQRSKWTEPENMGKSINSSADELYYVLHENGEEGVFVSNRLKKGESYCCDDLYEFKELDKVNILLGGEITLEEKQDNFQNTIVKLFMIDEETQEEFLVQTKRTNDRGEYLFRLQPNKTYKVKTERRGFLAQELELSTLGITNSQNLKRDLFLESYENKRILIKNIYYEFGSSLLSDKVMNTIDTTIYKVLVENPEIIIEIGSHTDAKGRAEYNLNLSQRRAESVVKYLRQKGIAKNRMTAKGYGEKQPIAPNENSDGSDNPEGRAKNRRTEFRVIGEVDAEIEYEE